MATKGNLLIYVGIILIILSSCFPTCKKKNQVMYKHSFECLFNYQNGEQSAIDMSITNDYPDFQLITQQLSTDNTNSLLFVSGYDKETGENKKKVLARDISDFRVLKKATKRLLK